MLNRRAKLSKDLEDELAEALGDVAIDDLMCGGTAAAHATGGAVLELESQQPGRVVAVRRDDVFVELGGREQGVLSLRQLPAPPAVGAMLEVIVQRFNPEDGLYDLSLPARGSSWTTGAIWPKG